jgi:hypothetical protein
MANSIPISLSRSIKKYTDRMVIMHTTRIQIPNVSVNGKATEECKSTLITVYDCLFVYEDTYIYMCVCVCVMRGEYRPESSVSMYSCGATYQTIMSNTMHRETERQTERQTENNTQRHTKTESKSGKTRKNETGSVLTFGH